MMRKLKCPQCKISNFYLKNDKNERRLVYVLEDLSIVCVKENETLQGYNIDVIFCLGCSWSGKVKQLVRY